ncbi:MAG: hypothetical protein KF850_39040 [Labilithrix sp.]|nr:hypothetical protein [Labilithrix sp.]MBX3218068.1 hypothetical protein [Labilithrix sp.]
MKLTALEREVLARSFAGNHPGLAALREQLASAEVQSREMTGVGFFTKLALDPNVAPVVVTSPRVAFGDVQAEIGGLRYGAGFVVFIMNGRLDSMEGFTYGEPWPVHIDTFTLRDGPDAHRGLSELRWP